MSNSRLSGHGRLLAVARSFVSITSALIVITAVLTLAVTAGSGSMLSLLDSSWTVETAIAATITAVIAIYFGAGTTRVLARAFPLRSDGTCRWAVVASLSVLGIAIEAVPVWAYFAMQAELDPDRPRDLTYDAGLAAVAMVAAGLAAILIFVAVIFPMAWTVARHVRRPRQRGVLYLRRFAGRGDTAILRILLGTVPHDVPVAFIAGPAFRPTSWDPLLLVFAGFRWFRPWSNIPLFLKSDDQTWQDDIRGWLIDSEVIVFDSSHQSPSVLVEAALIDSALVGSRTLLLQEEGVRATQPASFHGKPVVFYELSWISALPRIAVGMVTFFFAGTALFDMFLVNEVLAALIGVLVAAPLFFQPALSRGSSRRVRLALRTLLGARRGESPGSPSTEPRANPMTEQPPFLSAGKWPSE